VHYCRPWMEGFRRLAIRRLRRSNRATHVLFEPLALVERLAVLVPAPGLNLIRFQGVLAPAAKWRPSIVPEPVSRPDADTACDCENDAKPGSARAAQLFLGHLMARVLKSTFSSVPNAKDVPDGLLARLAQAYQFIHELRQGCRRCRNRARTRVPESVPSC
jgi:hypothetical protein